MSRDIADMAGPVTDFLTELAIKNSKRPELQSRGSCYNCDEPLPHPQKFCDADCRDDWEYAQKRRY